MYKEVLKHQFHAIALAMRTMTPGELVVLDIDETCLDNVQHVHGYRSEHDEIIPECREMFAAMVSVGLKYAFVSGRRETLRRDTLRDLDRAGLREYVDVYLCPENYNGTMWEFKLSARCDLMRRQYKIAATIGDQISDLFGGCTGMPFLLYNPHYVADASGKDKLL